MYQLDFCCHANWYDLYEKEKKQQQISQTVAVTGSNQLTATTTSL